MTIAAEEPAQPGPAGCSTQKGIAAMESAGIKVSPSPARTGKTLVEVLKG